jgi:hypothetical protein
MGAGMEHLRHAPGEVLVTGLRHIGKTIYLVPYARKLRKDSVAILRHKRLTFSGTKKNATGRALAAITRPQP